MPRDIQGGQVISLKAAGEDWARNIGFTELDLIAVLVGPSIRPGCWMFRSGQLKLEV